MPSISTAAAQLLALAALLPSESLGQSSVVPTFATPPQIAVEAVAIPAVPTGSTVALCARGSVIEIVFRVHDEHAPALRSAVEELANEIGGRLEGMHSYAAETALTDACVAVGALKTAVFAQVKAGDPSYKQRRN